LNEMAEKYCRFPCFIFDWLPVTNTEDKTEISNTYIGLDDKWTNATLA
jgi:hypothetical protein